MVLIDEPEVITGSILKMAAAARQQLIKAGDPLSVAELGLPAGFIPMTVV